MSRVSPANPKIRLTLAVTTASQPLSTPQVKRQRTRSPSLLPEVNKRARESLDLVIPDVSESSEEDNDSDPRKPQSFICPFADPSRENPCQAFAEPRKVKGLVSNHLFRIKQRGGDESHPINDPLWDDWIITGFYFARRLKLTPEERRRAMAESNKQHYHRRKKRQKREYDEKKKLWQDGLISTEEFRKILVGKVRVEFDAHLNAMEREQQMQEALQARGTNGSQDENSSSPPLATTTIPTSPPEKPETNVALVHAAKQALSLFGRSTADTLLSSQGDFFTYTGLTYPTEIRIDSYYFWAAYLTPMTSWPKLSPWDDVTHTNLKSLLDQQVKTWIASVSASPANKSKDQKAIQSRFHVFNKSWDLIARESPGGRGQGRMDEEAFQVKHMKLWDDAKVSIRSAIFEGIFTGAGKSACMVVEAMNALTSLLAGTEANDTPMTGQS
jgi:hypothetical protein